MGIISAPKYQQLMQIMRQEILECQLQPGEKILAEEELAQKYGVSRGTARQALAQLTNEGLLVRQQGRGTFVSDSRKKRTQSVGLLVHDISNPFFSQLGDSVQRRAYDAGYDIFYYNTDRGLLKEAKCIDMLIKKQVDGVLLVPAMHPEELEVLQKLKQAVIPFVCMNRCIHESVSDCVVTDNVDGTKQAIEYLLSLGHTNIACISAEPVTYVIRDRIAAYRNCLEVLGLLKDEPHIYIGSRLHYEGGYEAATMMLKSSNRPTAIFATTDIAAIGAMRAIRDNGYSIPDDFSIIGFDNIQSSAHLEVPLTTISQPVDQMGRVAMDLLLKRIEAGKEKELQKIIIKPELVIRESCKALQGE